VPASRAATGDIELLSWRAVIKWTLTWRGQRDGVFGGIAVDDGIDGFNAQTGVHPQEIGDEASNVWSSHGRSRYDVGGRTSPTKVSVLSVTTLTVPASQ